MSDPTTDAVTASVDERLNRIERSITGLIKQLEAWPVFRQYVENGMLQPPSTIPGSTPPPAEEQADLYQKIGRAIRAADDEPAQTPAKEQDEMQSVLRFLADRAEALGTESRRYPDRKVELLGMSDLLMEAYNDICYRRWPAPTPKAEPDTPASKGGAWSFPEHLCEPAPFAPLPEGWRPENIPPSMSCNTDERDRAWLRELNRLRRELHELQQKGK